jgi:hypothetical protein
MLSKEELAFIDYWKRNRLRRKKVVRQFLLGVPLGLLFVVPIIISLTSGWYKRANMEANSPDFDPRVLFVALLLIVGFVSIFWQRHKWDQYEQRYKELLVRRSREKSRPSTTEQVKQAEQASAAPMPGTAVSGVPSSHAPVSGTRVSGAPISGSALSATADPKTASSGVPAPGAPVSGTSATDPAQSASPASQPTLAATPIAGLPKAAPVPAAKPITAKPTTDPAATPIAGLPATDPAAPLPDPEAGPDQSPAE